jgi:uncharacterized protein (TIGR02757 family)
MPALKYRERLRKLYDSYNRREFVHPDPLEFLYAYPDPRDREIVGLIAASLAYGNVRQILKSVSRVLERLGRSPSRFVADTSRESLCWGFQDFKHRFTTGEELAAMLQGVRCAVERHRSLEACFCRGLEESHDTVVPALSAFVTELTAGCSTRPASLLPLPSRGSACKRLNLFLRWMVRNDDVDPGGWSKVPSAKLIVPLDTHMHRIALGLGLTSRKQANLETAIEITKAFRAIEKDDPVRYDFCLTRLGIRREMSVEQFVAEARGSETNVASLFAVPTRG